MRSGDQPRTLKVRASIENRLPGGRYRIALNSFKDVDLPAGPTRTIWVTVTGEPSSGAILLDHEITVSGGTVETAR